MLEGGYSDQVLSCAEIRKLVTKKYPNIFYKTILPSALCDNKSITPTTHKIFHYLGKNQYRVLTKAQLRIIT